MLNAHALPGCQPFVMFLHQADKGQGPILTKQAEAVEGLCHHSPLAAGEKLLAHSSKAQKVSR